MWYSAIQIKTSASETRHHRRQRTTDEDDGDYSNRGEIILYVVHKKSYFAMTQCAKVFAIIHMSRVSPQTHNITQINIVYVRTLKTECGGSINERVLLPRKQYNKKWSMSDINCLWRVFKMLQTRFLSLIDHPPQDQDRIRKYGPADLLSLWYK